MKKISEGIEGFYERIGGRSRYAKTAQRAAQVRAMWVSCVKPYILEHTNAVYIISEEDLETPRRGARAGGLKPENPDGTQEQALDGGKDADAKEADGKDKKQRKALVVYVDESICAAELNARREIIRLHLLQNYGEEIEEMKIRISSGIQKSKHPFSTAEEEPFKDTFPSVPLTEAELEHAREVASRIEDPKVRKSFLAAMVSDLEWKKGEEAYRKRTGRA